MSVLSAWMPRTVARASAGVLLCLAAASKPAQAQGLVDGALRGYAPAGTPIRIERLEQSSLGAAEVTQSQVARASQSGIFFLLRLTPGEYRVCLAHAAQGCSADAGTVTVEAGTVTDAPPIKSNSPRTSRVAASGLPALPPPAFELTDTTTASSLANDAADTADRTDPSTEDDNSSETHTKRDTAQSGSQASVSYAGLSPIEDDATLDGLSLRQGYRAGDRGAAAGGPRTASAYTQGAVRNVRVMPHTFSARYGAAGAAVAAVTRSGGSRAHGSMEFLFRGALLDAANPFSLATRYQNGIVSTNPIKPHGSAERISATFGLPLRNKRLPAWLPLWLRSAEVFGAADLQLRQATIVSTPAVAPGGPGFFALNATQRGLLGTRGVGATAIDAALTYLDSLTGSTQRNATQLHGLARFDFAPSHRDHVTFGYLGASLDAPRGAALGQVSDAVVARGLGSIGDSEVRVNAVNGRWLHIFAPRWSLELRGQFAQDLEYETPHAPLPQEPGISVDGLAPQVAIAESTFAYGTPASLGRSAYPDEQRVQLAVSNELRLGPHLIGAGFDWSRLHDRVASISNAAGSFSYDSGLTGGAGSTGAHAGGLVDWITDYTFNVHAYPNGGCPNIAAPIHYFCFRSFTQSFGGTETTFATHELSAFVEDAVRLRTDLALTVGARWDYTLLPPPQAVNSPLDAELDTLGIAAGGLTGRIPEDRNNYGPRVGLTYSPRWLRGTTVQLGAGSFFGRVPGATVRAALADTALASTVRRVRITPVTITACPQVANQGFGYPCAYTATPPAAVLQTTSAVVFARRFRLPAVHRATLAVEHTWSRGFELRAEYATAMALQLPSTTDLNIAPSTAQRSFILQGGEGRTGVRDGETFTVPVYTARRFADVGPVTAVTSHANATYHAATLAARWSGRGALHGWALRTSYTFSRAIDYAPQQGATPQVDSQFDPFANGYDKGLSSLHFPQRFSGALVYETRMERGSPRLRRALDGWHVAALAAVGSGRPYSEEIFGGSDLSGGRESINGAGGATYLPTVGRNTRHLPAQATVDLRLSRDILTAARLRVALFAEAFNVLNARNVSGVETRAFLVGAPASAAAPTPLLFQDAATVAAEGVALPAFGTPTSSTTGLSRERQLALGVRLNF